MTSEMSEKSMNCNAKADLPDRVDSIVSQVYRIGKIPSKLPFTYLLVQSATF